jgi:glycosyltransferase involved in cell wall biosynthesis
MSDEGPCTVGPVRVLTVANHLGARGGLERTQLTICSALAARGHTVDLMFVTEGDFAQDWRRFSRSMVPIAGSLPRRAHPLASSRAVASALRAAARLAPDVIYVFRYWDVPFAVALGTLSRTPVVFHLCLPPPNRTPVWLRACLSRVADTLAVSRDTASRWTHSGLRADRTDVVLTGIDLDHYVPADEEARNATRRSMGWGLQSFVVLYAGRIGREKGVDVLVKAFMQLQSEHDGCELAIVGSASLGADPEDSERFAAELRTTAEGSAVSWTPARRDIVALIPAADVSVVPSLWPEPLSRSVMEPLGCGIPVVASRAGGNPELLTDWLAEFLVEPGDDTALAGRLAALRGWRTGQPDLGARCRHEAEERFSLRAEIDAIERHLTKATEGPGRRRWRAHSGSDARS